MKTAFQLGDTIVHAKLHEHGAGPTYLNVHDDEDTSVQAGLVNLARHGGRLIELVHSGERLITFGLDGQRYSFDPNRIFSDAGISETLRRHSRYSASAHEEIRRFAHGYREQFALDSESIVVALHNATEGPFSVEAFLPDGYLGAEAELIHMNCSRSKYDFFFVTERRFFEWLRQRNFNAVLQNNREASDDGSLSVYFAARGIPYINVEAKNDHLANQIEMLELVREIMTEFGFKYSRPA